MPSHTARTSQPLVLAFTGMPAAGKGEAVAAAKTAIAGVELPVVRMGDLVWERVEELGLPLTPENVGRVANKERQRQGDDVWALTTVKRVKELLGIADRADATETEAPRPGPEGTDTRKTSPAAIIDGLRSPAELAVFRAAFGDRLVVVAVVAPSSVRAARVTGRGRVDDTADRAGFTARDERELAWGLGDVMEVADHVVENKDCSVEEFQAAVRALVTELLGQPERRA